MSLAGWLGLWLGVAYLGVATIVGRMLAGHWAYRNLEQEKKRYPMLARGERLDLEWGDPITGALLVAPLWPIVLLIIAVGHSRIPTMGAEKDHELKVRRERIEAAEKELGLR